MELYRIHGREESWRLPTKLVDFRIGDPMCKARWRSSTRRGRFGHEAWECRDGGTCPEGGRLGHSRRGGALLRGRGRLCCGLSRRDRRVVRDRDDVIALGLLAAIRRDDDLV